MPNLLQVGAWKSVSLCSWNSKRILRLWFNIALLYTSGYASFLKVRQSNYRIFYKFTSGKSLTVQGDSDKIIDTKRTDIVFLSL